MIFIYESKLKTFQMIIISLWLSHIFWFLRGCFPTQSSCFYWPSTNQPWPRSPVRNLCEVPGRAVAMTSATSSLASLHRDESAALPGVVRSSLSPAVGGTGVWGLGKGGTLGRFSGWYGYVMGYCTTTGYGLLMFNWCFLMFFLNICWLLMLWLCHGDILLALVLPIGSGLVRLERGWQGWCHDGPLWWPPNCRASFEHTSSSFFFEHCSPI